MNFKKKERRVHLSCEDAPDKNDRRLRIKEGYEAIS